MKKVYIRSQIKVFAFAGVFFMMSLSAVYAAAGREEQKQKEVEALQERFKWWPTDAKPAPVKDDRGGYWWWPTTPGEMRPWGNRGYIYVYKIIYDYKEEELPPAKPEELRPSLMIKKIIKNVKLYFDYDKADLRGDAIAALNKAVGTLNRNPESSILITGNADIRGTEAYNEKLARRRAESVKEFMLQKSIPEDRIKIVSRGKLDAVAPVTDLVGMQKDRNAQFMIAEIEEVMLPAPQAQAAGAKPIEDGKYLVEEQVKLEGDIKVATREYTIQKGDTLGKIALEQMGGAYRWKYLYEINKDRIKNPNRLPVGQTIVIPVEVGAETAAEPAKMIGLEKTAMPESASQAVAGETRSYTIQRGDTLGEIAQKELGSARRTKEILELNKDAIKDSNKLRVGQAILLPAK